VTDTRGLILNVDDYEASRYARSQLLARAGFEVIEAGSGGEALRVTAERRPDLVLLDVNLPDMDGFEVCRRLRARPSTLTVPIVHISATFLSDKAADLAYEGGADSYLTDPVEPAVLLAGEDDVGVAEENLGLVFGVDSTDDLPDDAIGDGICLLTNFRCTLRAAVQEANANAGLDTIALGAKLHEIGLREGATSPRPSAA